MSTGSQVERTLIVMSEPLGQILSGRKTYEVRSRPTRLVGRRIALSEKGKNRIVATCTLKECLGPFTLKEVLGNAVRMGFKRSEILAERAWWRRECAKDRVYAWVLRDVRRLRRPVKFRNPSGAVIWAQLPMRIMKTLW
jgi:predicted transcriptional regulator